MLSIRPKQPTGPIRFCFQSINLRFYISFRSFRPDFLSILYDRGVVPPLKAHFYVHVFVSGGRQLCSLLYPVRQLHHVCRVDAFHLCGSSLIPKPSTAPKDHYPTIYLPNGSLPIIQEMPKQQTYVVMAVAGMVSHSGSIGL